MDFWRVGSLTICDERKVDEQMDTQNDASPVGLTEMQQVLLSRKLDMLRKDFPIVALYVRVEGGQEWKVGDVQLAPPPAPEKAKKYLDARKSKRVQKNYYDTPRGTCNKVLLPWIELAGSEFGTTVVIRPDDVPEIEWHRVSRAASGIGFNRYGRGRLHVEARQDEFGPLLRLVVDAPKPEVPDAAYVRPNSPEPTKSFQSFPPTDYIEQELLQTAKAVLAQQPTKSFLGEANSQTMKDRVQNMQDNFNRDRKR